MSVVPFPRPKTTPAAVGDLAVVRLKQAPGDWCVLSVAGVDDEGAVSMLRDLDGQAIALYRICAIDEPWFITPAAVITPEGRAALPGECAEHVDDLKAAFRRYFVGGVGA